jgi:hypothetical protein
VSVLKREEAEGRQRMQCERGRRTTDAVALRGANMHLPMPNVSSRNYSPGTSVQKNDAHTYVSHSDANESQTFMQIN